MPFFAAQHSLFRAYDIRGSRQHFTDDFIQALGHAFAHLYQLQKNIDNDKSIIVIGYDVRHDSDVIAQKLASILNKCGLQVVQLGLITTPMMVFWAEQYQGHGIVVTASHSAKDILGVKWLVNHQSPSVEDIQALYQQVIHHQLAQRSLDNSLLAESGLYQHELQKMALHKNNKSLKTAKNCPTVEKAYLSPKQVASAYINAIVQVFKALYPNSPETSINNIPHGNTADQQSSSNKLDLIVVIDCMHGATSHIAQSLFTHFCQHVIMLNDNPDGNFPSGNPDPTEPCRLKQLQQSVIEHHADIGIAFDGDGDRLMIVDNNGKVVTSDQLLYLLAKVAVNDSPKLLTSSPSTTQVLFDIKCGHHLPKLITELGATAVMSRTGSSLIRRRLQQPNHQIIFAGELSGHFIFNDHRFILYDDAMYAALRLLHWLVQSMSNFNPSANLAEIIDGLPIIVSTADHYLPLPETVINDCSILEQLTQLCLYLQQLIEATSISSTHPDYQPIIDGRPAHCTCSAKRHSISLEQAQDLLPIGTKLSCIDGVRLDFAHGFGVLRQSNTSHNLTARFAGDSIEDLKDIQAKFAALCRPFDENLAAQIMAISPQ